MKFKCGFKEILFSTKQGSQLFGMGRNLNGLLGVGDNEKKTIPYKTSAIVSGKVQ